MVGLHSAQELSDKIIIIEDDEMSRAVLELIAAEAGLQAESFASGKEALAWLDRSSAKPSAILTDIQMPGISGAALAGELRARCGSSTCVIAMSGSPIVEETRRHFDAFLLKPFTVAALSAACARTRPITDEPLQAPPSAKILDEAVYGNLARSMPPTQLVALYRLCLDDADKRIASMKLAQATGDDDVYRRAAHAIKGGCAMVGAVELAAIAAMMETEGLSGSQNMAGDASSYAPLDLFLAAATRLQRMLDSKVLHR